MAGELLEDFEKKKNSRQKLEWLLPISSARLRPRFGVNTGRGAAHALPRHCARSVLATWLLGVRTVHTTQFCDRALFRSLFGSLFIDTVHRVKKKNFVWAYVAIFTHA